MNKLFLIYILLGLSVFGKAQIAIELKDTLLNNSNVKYSCISIDYFPEEIERKINLTHSDIFRFEIDVKNIFWDSLIVRDLGFYNVYGYSYYDSESSSIKFMILDNKNVTDLNSYELNDTILLDFVDKITGETLSVPIIIEDLSDGNFEFRINHFHYAFVEKIKKYIIIWAYQMGVNIAISDSIYFNRNDVLKYYNLGEIYTSYDSTKYVFNNYNHSQNKISLLQIEKNTKVYGYKQGDNIEPNILLSGKFTVLYFGGHWCLPCKKENPKLKRMNEVSLDNNFDLIVNLSYQNGDKNLSLDYYNEYLSPLKYRLLDLQSLTLRILEIKTFPTYIFVDKNGKILYRSDISDDEPHFYFWNLIKQQKI